jgi:hypothetical protein
MFNCEDFTFILSSRNDGYSCVNKPWEDEQRKKIENCIYSSEKTFPNRKFILLDYNTPKQNKKLSDLFKGYKNLKIISVGQKLQDDLNADNKEKKITFYEFIAKHLGSLFCETENMIFINQDLVFPLKNRELLINSIRNNEVNVAFRCKVDYNLINLSVEKLYDLCNSPFSPQIKIADVYGNGDFLGIKKEKYESLGGYLLSHQNWAVDNEILYRLGLTNMHPIQQKADSAMKIVRNYATISLDHPEDPIGVERKKGEDFKRIDANIISNLKSYIEEIY